MQRLSFLCNIKMEVLVKFYNFMKNLEYCCNKKEKRRKYMKRKKFIAICAGGILLIGCVAGSILYWLNWIPHRKYTNKDFGIETYVSSVDQDQDGIDDQTDILEGCRAYIATNPKYKSKYYAGGYPDDEYGVCTDVVAFSLLAAGYDLQQLVAEDIENHREDYDIKQPDPNIDFRRVRNLRVYFERNAISLTTDITDVEEWQGGDIIIFEKHIGMVSDKRNKKGVSFLIHNGSPTQVGYEQDVLEYREDIVGHYRMN